MRATLGKVKGMIVQIQQGVHGGITLYDDGSAIATIATVWPATRDKLLTAKADRTSPARARGDVEIDLVEERRPGGPPSQPLRRAARVRRPR